MRIFYTYTMPSKTRQFGNIGENLTKDFLIKSGYKIIDRNFRVKNLGEIDLIAEKNNKLVFFEVKTRNVKHETNFPIEFSINERKRRNLKRVCQLYLLGKQCFTNKDWQVDAIFIRYQPNGAYEFGHFENILWEKYY